MSGHHPWSELTRHFTPEDREIVEAGAAEIVADSDRREREAERPARPARVLSARRRHRAAATGSRSSSVQTGRASVAPVRFAEVGRAGEQLDHPAVLGRVVVPSRRPGGRSRP